KRDVLAIGFDSTNADEEGNYVYVKKEDGSLEKRYIEIGVTDDCHYEVISGLSEGEEVYYTQEAYAPPRYEEYTVETGIQRTTVLAGNLKKAETVNTAYFAPCKGKIESINIDTNSEVKKGDVLLVIDSGSGEAAIQEVENDIKHLKMDHDKYNEDADKNIKTLTVQGLRLLTTIEEGKDHGTIDQTDEDCIGCQRAVFELRAKIAEVEKEASRIEYEAQLSRLNRRLAKLRKDNNGSGKISVVAKEDSIVSRLYVKEGDLVEPGKTNYLLLSCTRASEGMASVNLNKETILPGVGCNIEIDINEKDDKYFGTAVSCVSAGKAYAFTEGEKTTLSVAEGNGISGAKYIIFELEDKEFFDKVQIKDCETKVQTIYAENMVIVPGSVVYKEENQLTEKERFFVWKLVNGTPVKQYVIKGSTYGIGTDASVVILRGLEPGDKVAKESSAAGNTKEEQ
ncbi:MAG: biotin/lipoyl-binding protein, partial [Lachnospiraceae bacterium]|nr:biotin/lipoyl-binding protein [Lachnospiraceae bacterium]